MIFFFCCCPPHLLDFFSFFDFLFETLEMCFKLYEFTALSPLVHSIFFLLQFNTSVCFFMIGSILHCYYLYENFSLQIGLGCKRKNDSVQMLFGFCCLSDLMIIHFYCNIISSRCLHMVCPTFDSLNNINSTIFTGLQQISKKK